MDYWKECIKEAFEDAGIDATEDQIGTVAFWVEGTHDNFSMAHGHDCIPNPMLSEVEKLKKAYEKLVADHDKQIEGVRSGVALRRKVSVSDVHIDEEGHVTYDAR